MSNSLHSDTGSSCLFSPFFVRFLDTYHPRGAVSCQSGALLFFFLPRTSTVYRCTASCHLAPAHISLLRSSSLHAATLPSSSAISDTLLWIWCQVCCTRPLTLLSMVTTEQKTNSFPLKLEPTGYFPGCPVGKTPGFHCGEAQVPSLVWELRFCMPQGTALNTPPPPKLELILQCFGFPAGLDCKESACNAGDPGLIPGSGRSPGEGHGNPLQYSCLENCMERGAWWFTVHGVEKCWTQLSNKQ